MDAAAWGLGTAVFLASTVEMVEAMTIVMAMGMTRSWRSTLAGVAASLVALAAFGTFWSVEGLGILQPGRQSLEWPGADLAIIALVVAWFVLSRVLVAVLRRTRHAGSPPAPANQPVR